MKMLESVPLACRLRVNDVLFVFGPDRAFVRQIGCCVGGDVFYIAHHHVVDVDVITRRRFRLDGISQSSGRLATYVGSSSEISGVWVKFTTWPAFGETMKISHCSSPSLSEM